MTAKLLALGQRGAAMAQACLMQAMMGLFPSVDVLLMAAPQEDGERITRLFQQYEQVHRHTGGQPGIFSP